MKKLFIITILLFFYNSVFSQNIEDKFTKQNWTEFYILTEGCQKIDVIEDENGDICPVYLDEQGFCFYVTLVEAHVYTVTIKCKEEI